MVHIDLTGFADEIHPDLEEQIRVLHKLGMKYIEMRGVNGKPLIQHSLEEARAVRKRLDEEGLALSSVGSSIGKIGILDDFAPHLELFRHTMEIAHLMGTKNIRVFSFFIPAGEAPETYRGAVMERLGALCDLAAEGGVTLLHENEKEIYGDNAERCLELMKNFYGPHFKAVFDFANFVQVGQETLPAYATLRPYIDYIHVKDAIFGSGEVRPAGLGDGHVKEILTDLLASGYTGFLSLEPHLADFTGFAALERTQGSAEPERTLTGEEAFTLAHDSLLKILREIESE